MGGLGLILPTFPQDSNALPAAHALVTLCRDAEGAGASALWACDHLFWHGPSLETLTALGLAASATRAATIGSCVLQLPLRSVPALAKEAAGLQHLSEGRLVLGVGAGMHRGEYGATGVDFTVRGRHLDQGIDRLRHIWSADPDSYPQLPVPTPIPVWIGGSSEAALRRAARRGDGWIPLFVAPDEYAAALGRLDKEADRAGRDPVELARAIVVFVSLGRDTVDSGLRWMSTLYGLPARSFARHLVAGDARTCATALARFVEAGAQHVAVFLTTDEPSTRFEELAGEFARQAGELGPTEPGAPVRSHGHGRREAVPS